MDGKSVAGTINVKEGQELSLTYEIIDGSHKLVEAAGGIPVVGWGESYTKVTKPLTIRPEMNGHNITRGAFGIAVKEE